MTYAKPDAPICEARHILCHDRLLPREPLAQKHKPDYQKRTD
jgi:hypothetical protein